MRVLVAGCGYVGGRLAGMLVAEGATVFGLRRRPDGLPRGVRPVAADLRDPATLRGLPGELDAVVYAASADRRDEAAYRAAYVDGVRHVLEASGARRFLFTSSTSVYGQCRGEWVDEASPAEPARFPGRILREGEARVLGGHPAPCVVRLGGIYGPGRTRLLERVAQGHFRWRPGHFTNRIHRDDCAGTLRHLLRLPEPPPLLLGVDCEPAEERVVGTWLAERLRVPPPASAEADETPGAGSKRCSNRRLLATGYAYRFPTFREGYADVAGWPAP